VPVINGKTPNDAGSRVGRHSVPVKKSIGETFLKNGTDWLSRTQMMPNVVTTLKIAQANEKNRATRSVNSFQPPPDGRRLRRG
jgi:hypothetical protein